MKEAMLAALQEDLRVPPDEIWIGPVRRIHEGPGAPRWEPAMRLKVTITAATSATGQAE